MREKPTLCVAGLLGTLIVSGLMACSPDRPEPAWEGDRTLTESGEIVRLMQTIRRIDAAWQRKQLRIVRRAMTDDVVLLPPGEPELVGRDEAVDWFREWSRPYVLRDTRTTESVSIEGSFAIETWNIERLSTRRRDGRETRLRLKGVSVYHRGDDAIYRLSYRLWNETAPPVDGPDLR